MSLKDMSVAELRRLPELPNQVLVRMGVIRLKTRMLCRECEELVDTVPLFGGNDTWNLVCPNDRSLISHVDTEQVFVNADPPFTPEDSNGKQRLTADRIPSV